MWQVTFEVDEGMNVRPTKIKQKKNKMNKKNKKQKVHFLDLYHC